MIKNCKICQGDIDANKDRYAIFKDMDGKKERSKGYYHFSCFMERIAYEAEAVNTLGMAKQMLIKANEKMGLVN